jgi:CBS domain-containing protein
MRTAPIKREIRKIGENIQHAFHGRMHTRRPHKTEWRRLGEKRELEPRLTIYDTMQKRPIAVHPYSPLRRALALMIQNQISGLPVVDAADRIVGVLNESDLLKIFYEPHAVDVASVMTRDPAVVSVHAPLTDLVDQMMATGFRRVLVHEHGKLVGIVTRAQLMPTILEGLEQELCDRGADRTRMTGSEVSH